MASPSIIAPSSLLATQNDDHADDDDVGSTSTSAEERLRGLSFGIRNDKNRDIKTSREEQYDTQRRQMLWKPVAAALLTTSSSLVVLEQNPANALVKGNAPPPKSSKPASDKPRCTNVEECQAEAERRADEERLRLEADAASDAASTLTTAQGTRYRDLQVGSGKTAAAGDEVTVFYKVLKLGKRSYDGISGEGTVVFSRGYGLEDDERKPRDKSFVTTLGYTGNIAALNDAVPGMREGGLRRFAVAPERGWRKPGRACDGGPGGTGAGGDLKTDYVVVPTATMVASEACFDTTRQPFPLQYAEQRRMAQRFDQSLIMEVELVRVGSGDSSFL